MVWGWETNKQTKQRGYSKGGSETGIETDRWILTYGFGSYYFHLHNFVALISHSWLKLVQSLFLTGKSPFCLFLIEAIRKMIV